MSCNGKLFCYESTKDLALDIAIKILSWLLICGLATSVNLKTFTSRLREKAILVGVACQFFMFPFVGFLCIIAYQLSPVNSLVLLILVSSPGGSYSNLWCSLWNADLALSVAMTSVSTCCSLFMLPWNLFLYVNTLYPLVQGGTCGDDVNSTGCEPAETEWSIIGFTLAIVISAVLTGLLIGEKFPSQRDRANMIGNICGLLSIVLSVFVSGSSDTPPWEQPINVIMACGTPLIVGVAIATLIARVLKLEKPKAVAIGVETGYQSVTIALIYAFQLGEEGKAAIGLTVIYGAWEIVVFGVFCFTLWKLGWTYSPSTKLVDLPRMLFFNFQDKEKQEARSGSLATGI